MFLPVPAALAAIGDPFVDCAVERDDAILRYRCAEVSGQWLDTAQPDPGRLAMQDVWGSVIAGNEKAGWTRALATIALEGGGRELAVRLTRPARPNEASVSETYWAKYADGHVRAARCTAAPVTPAAQEHCDAAMAALLDGHLPPAKALPPSVVELAGQRVTFMQDCIPSGTAVRGGALGCAAGEHLTWWESAVPEKGVQATCAAALSRMSTQLGALAETSCTVLGQPGVCGAWQSSPNSGLAGCGDVGGTMIVVLCEGEVHAACDQVLRIAP